MDDRYRLVFRGEVLEGQHNAVVKKKLAQALGIKDEAKLEKMFAGKAVVIRKDADTKTAAKFQAAFKKAGARLRVLPVVLSIEELEAKEAAEVVQATQNKAGRDRADAVAAMPDQVGFNDTAAWALMPAGSPVLAEEEREEIEPAEVPTDHISLDKAEAFAPQETPEKAAPIAIDAPDFDIAAVGAVMAPASSEDEAELTDLMLDADFSVAEVGAELVKPSAPIEVPEVLLESDFDLAEPGAVLGSGSEELIAPPAPDVSHLAMAEEEAEEGAQDEPVSTRASFS